MEGERETGGGGGGWREKGGIEGERGGKWRESHYYHFLSNSPFPLSPAARLQQLKPPWSVDREETC